MSFTHFKGEMMIDPISANIFVNQNAPVAAAKLGDLQNRFELQSVQALKAISEEGLEIQELRPAEESHLLDPDRESERQKHDQEEKNRANLTKSTQKEDEDDTYKPSPNHIIDIKV